jgi:hypothetical protein
MKRSLEKAKDRVEYLLRQFPETRDCDRLLWLAYLCTFHNLQGAIREHGYAGLRKIVCDPATCSMESVRRTRQKFQEGGRYLGEKRQERLREEVEVREYINDFRFYDDR